MTDGQPERDGMRTPRGPAAAARAWPPVPELSGRPDARLGVRRMATGKRRGRRLSVEDLVSCGGIVYRRAADGPEFVLCGRSSTRLWGLPKGTPMPGESHEQTARREVRE